MLNRVADTLYWIGRYVERAEDTARILDVQFHADLERGLGSTGRLWEALFRAASAQDLRGGLTDRDVIEYMVLSRENRSSIRSCLAIARDNARTVREVLSREFWEELNACFLELNQMSVDVVLADLSHVCRRIRNTAQLVIGLADATLLHDEALCWLKSGVFLERADMTTRFIDSKAHLLIPAETAEPSVEHFQWTAVLKAMSAWEAYRKVDREGLSGRGIIRFLLFDNQFPRSVQYAVAVSGVLFEQATARTPARRKGAVLRAYADLANKIRYDDIDEALRGGLSAYLHDLQRRIGTISFELNTAIFNFIPDRV